MQTSHTDVRTGNADIERRKIVHPSFLKYCIALYYIIIYYIILLASGHILRMSEDVANMRSLYFKIIFPLAVIAVWLDVTSLESPVALWLQVCGQVTPT